MKVQSLLNLYLLNVLVLPLMGLDDGFHFPYFYRMSSVSMPTIVGRLYEEVILPCSFKKGRDIVIHWKKDNKALHSYYRKSDQLEKQDPHYAHRTSLLLNEINNGNASLKLKRLNLQDEGVYTCYAATETDSKTTEVELKLGAFIIPVMEYREQNGNDYLTCYLFGAYPFANITWTANNATNPENNIEVSSHPLLSVKSQLNITGSNSSYQCIIENSVLNQRWIGKWKTEGTLLIKEGEKVLFPCKLKNADFLPEKSINVSWYRVKNASSIILAYFSSSSSRRIIDHRFTWTKDMMQEKENFSLTLIRPTPSDSGKYLCNISSVSYTQLTIQPLKVEPSKGRVQKVIPGVLLPLIVAAFIVFAALCYKKHGKKKTSNSNSNPTENNHEQTPFQSSPREDQNDSQTKDHENT